MYTPRFSLLLSELFFKISLRAEKWKRSTFEDIIGVKAPPPPSDEVGYLTFRLEHSCNGGGGLHHSCSSCCKLTYISLLVDMLKKGVTG